VTPQERCEGVAAAAEVAEGPETSIANPSLLVMSAFPGLTVMERSWKHDLRAPQNFKIFESK